MALFIVLLLTLFRHIMDIVNLLPSPRKLMRTAISLFNSMAFVLPFRLGQDNKFSTTDFEIDDETGFLPRKPLPHLQGPFGVWEEALREAPNVLSLGEDDSETGLERRCSGEIWRRKVESVGGLWVNLECC
jgi:indoleamine 2,3-dioxygenase